MNDTSVWPAEVAVAAAAYGLCELPADFYELSEADRLKAATALLPDIKAATGPAAEQFFRNHGKLFGDAPAKPVETAPLAEPAAINRLVAITTYFNPCGYRRPRENYDRFAAGLAAAGVELLTAELTFDDEPFQIAESERGLRIRGRRDRHLLWQKERLLNLLIQRLPTGVDAVAWLDCDVLFLNPNWPAETREALSRHQVVQLFESPYHLHPGGRLEPMRPSCGWAYKHRNGSATHLHAHHPGFAWAARADILRRFGLLDDVVTGGGDSLMLKGFMGRTLYGLERAISPAWLSRVERWASAFHSACGGAVGYVGGSILHLWHGSTENRRYLDRWKYLTDSEFSPDDDLDQDAAGLWVWSDRARREKPAMIRQVADYFAERQEDA